MKYRISATQTQCNEHGKWRSVTSEAVIEVEADDAISGQRIAWDAAQYIWPTSSGWENHGAVMTDDMTPVTKFNRVDNSTTVHLSKPGEE